MKNLQYTKYLIQFEQDILNIQKRLILTSTDSNYFRREFIKGDLPFDYFYVGLSNGYVSSSINKNVNDVWLERLANSRCRNISAAKRSLKRQKEILKEMTIDISDLKENLIVHKYIPLNLGIVHTVEINKFQGEITKNFIGILINLVNNKLIQADYCFTFNASHNRYENKWHDTPLFTEEQIKNLNDALYS